MSIRTEGDAVAASNLSCELSLLVARFLRVYRKHADGVNRIKVPFDFTVVLKQPTKNDADQVFINCTLIHERTVTYDVPTYFEPDDDNFVEGYSADLNVSGYTTESMTSIERDGVSIPWQLLLLSDEMQIKYCKDLKATSDAKEAEEARRREIARLRNQLEALESEAKHHKEPTK